MTFKTIAILISFLFFIMQPGFSGYDESRNIFHSPKGSGKPFSELRRPGDQHLNWEGPDLSGWREAPEEAPEDPAIFSRAGGLNGKWRREALGDEIIEKAFNQQPIAPDRWERIQFTDYHQDIADPNLVSQVTRNPEDPGWNVGTILEWEIIHPGIQPVANIPEKSYGLLWNQGMPMWQANLILQKNRPIQNVRRTG